MRWRGRLMVAALMAGVLAAGEARARDPRPPRPPRPPRAPRTPKPPPAPPAPPLPTNVHFTPAGTIALPGRGLALSWSPDATRIAAGGRFRDKATGLRYDTRVADVVAQALVKSFACHWFFVVATAWSANPFLGEVLADGGGDHAVKVWDPAGPGSSGCKPGQFLAADGGLQTFTEINGWITALAFSPDGRFLAGASRDRMVRVWQLAPGPGQFQVVTLLYDRNAGNFASMAWMPDGRGMVTGDRRGRIVSWDFDPDRDRWDDATIAAFAKVSYEGQPGWCGRHPAETARNVRWLDGGHGWAWNVRVAPDGSQVAGVGSDGTLSVFDAASGAVAYRTGAPEATPLHALDWSPDGALLAAGGNDRMIYVVDAASGDRYDVLAGHADVVSAVAWSPDGRTLASTAGGQRISLALLNVSTGPDQTIRLWSRD